MINLTKYELKLIAGNRGIKNYENMSKEKLLSAIVKSEHITENLSQNKLKQIAKTRRIRNYKDMSKKDLLIALLKSNQSHAELRRSEDNNAEIGKTKKFLTNLEIKKIRRKFRFREDIIEYLKELEQKDNLTEQENQEKKRYTRKLQKAE